MSAIAPRQVGSFIDVSCVALNQKSWLLEAVDERLDQAPDWLRGAPGLFLSQSNWESSCCLYHLLEVF